MPTAHEKFRGAVETTSRFFRSRHKTGEMLRTLALVVPLTCLIWIYAERTQVATDKAQISLVVASSVPNLVPSVLDQSMIVVELSGPRVRVEALKAKLEARSSDRRTHVTLPDSYRTAGDFSVPIAQLLNEDKSVESTGVTITAATPSSVTVRLEQVVSRSVPLKVPDDLTVALEHVVFEPATVIVRGTASMLDRYYPRLDTPIEVDFKDAPADAFSAGKPHTLTVQVRRPVEGLSVEPGSVKISFDVAARDAEYTIPSLPISIQMILTLQKHATVELTRQQTLPNIRVRGPVDAIAKLRPGVNNQPPALQPSAVLKIGPDDVGKTELTRSPQITDLPKDVVVVGEVPKLEFSVRDTSSNGE
jgi:hypothetical protein